MTIEQTGQTPDQRTADTPNATPEQVDWEKRYKDLQSYHSRTVSELQSKIPAQDFETENEKLQRQVAELHADLNARNVADKVRDAQAQVAVAHPDYAQVIPSEAFAAWIKVQPQVFQDAIYGDIPDATLAIKALSLFKMETRPQQASQQQRQADPAAMAVRQRQRVVPEEIRGPRIWTSQEIQRMTPSEFAANEAEIDKAFAEGRIR